MHWGYSRRSCRSYCDIAIRVRWKGFIIALTERHTRFVSLNFSFHIFFLSENYLLDFHHNQVICMNRQSGCVCFVLQSISSWTPSIRDLLRMPLWRHALPDRADNKLIGSLKWFNYKNQHRHNCGVDSFGGLLAPSSLDHILSTICLFFFSEMLFFFSILFAFCFHIFYWSMLSRFVNWKFVPMKCAQLC